jgi:hypothetical protein
VACSTDPASQHFGHFSHLNPLLRIEVTNLDHNDMTHSLQSSIKIIEEKHRCRYTYVYVRVCSHMRLVLPYVFYMVWCLSKSYAHTNNCKNKITHFKKKKGKNWKEKYNSTVGTNVRVRGFNAGLLASSQFAFGRSCDPAKYVSSLFT